MDPQPRDGSSARRPVVGSTGVVRGIAGTPGRRPPTGGAGCLETSVLKLRKRIQVSRSPKARRSCGPVTVVVPAVPTTPARTIRGETPRFSTRICFSRPFTSPPSERVARVSVHRNDLRPVVGRDGVVRVGDALEPRLGVRADEAVLDVLGAPAAGGEEERGDRVALVGDDAAGGRADGGAGRRGLRGDAPVHLRARVRVLGEVAGGPARVRRDRVGARGDGLRAQRLVRPRGGHLGGDDAGDVVLEAQRR